MLLLLLGVNHSYHTRLFSSGSICFLLDLDVTISNLDAGYIFRLFQMKFGYFRHISIIFFSVSLKLHLFPTNVKRIVIILVLILNAISPENT